MDFQRKDRYNADDLLAITALLRGPNGCPWDKEQTHESVRRNFIEETYEAIEAIDTGDSALLQEELGDVLFQVVFHARMEEEQGGFTFGDVCDQICKKMIFRHPHIFSDAVADTAQDVVALWDVVKKKEKAAQSRTDVLQAVPKALPALIRAEKVQAKAAGSGDADYRPEGLHRQVDKLTGGGADEAKDKEEMTEALGDMLFAAVNLARTLEIDPEEALNKASDKFIGCFAHMEEIAAERKIVWDTADVALLNSLWQEAKNKTLLL